jgi:hypothetical protein
MYPVYCKAGRSACGHAEGERNRPPTLDPADHLSAEPKRVCGVEKTAASALQHLALVDERVEDATALRDEIVQLSGRGLREGVFSKEMSLPHPCTGRGWCTERRRGCVGFRGR